MRLIGGRRLRVHGIPRGAVAGSIGRDAGGRIVLTVRVAHGRPAWWLYDVKADRVRPLRGVRSCNGAVAVWRRRVAHFDDCPAEDQAVVLHEPGRTRRFRAFSEGGFEQVALRGNSLAAMGEADEDLTIFQLLDRGRPCHADISGDAADGPFWAHRLTITDGRLAWVMALDNIFDNSPATHPTVMGLALNGRCTAPAAQRYLGTYADDAPVRAVTVDARKLYYATERGLYVQRLPARGSTAAPPNDDFEHATAIRGPLPVRVDGVVGYATRQPGEPDGFEPPDLRGAGTIWYRFEAPVSQRVHVEMGLGGEWVGNAILTGDRLDALTPLSGYFAPGYTFDAVAGASYWIVVSAGPPVPAGGPGYRFIPFRITISSA